jgi:iron complex outermembrane receptor protein
MTVIRSAIDAAVKAAVKGSKTEPRVPKQLTRTLWTAALVLGLGATAQAQQAPQGPGKPADESASQAGAPPAALEEITVTGSRIKRTNDFNTPTPTTVIDTAAMDAMGITNIGQTLTLTPANVSTFTPANTGNSPYFVGSYIPDLRGLNPYFGSRTLTLIDGQRFVQTEQGDQIDLNLIPQILVQRIDVVTGGASAAYGSGAIAGVENIILENKLEGGKITGDWFQTSRSDAKDRHIGAAYGQGLFDDKVHFVLGGELEHQDGLGCQGARSWCAQDQGAFQSTPAGSARGVTTYTYGSGLRNFNSPYGVFVQPAAGSTSTWQGNPDGNGAMPYALAPAPYPFAPAAFNNTMPGGQGTPIYQYQNLMTPVSRGVIMGLFTGNITDSIHWKGTLYYGKTESTKYQATVASTFADINAQNAFIQGNALQNIVAGAGPFGARINKDWTTQMPSFSQFTSNVRRATVGLDGKFGSSSWTWDANYEYGLTHHDQLLHNNLHYYEAAMALDSVVGPNGQPECRVTAVGFANAVAQNPFGGYAGANPSLANGCVPLNPFGNQALSAAQAGYAFGDLVEQLRYQQTDANINASGEIFDGIGAGAFTAAVGYEYRQETGRNIDNPGVPAAVAGDYLTQFGTSFGGIVTVHEGYLETNLPLAKDLPFAHLLELDLAGRESRYINRAQFGINTATPGVEGHDFGHNLTTWKASAIWEPIDSVRFRASQSRDARAANFRELYYGQVIGAGGLFGYCGPSGSFTDACTWNLEGNVKLRPETSDTTTLGVVLTPRDFLSGVSFSADWFHIKIKNAISPANPNLVLNGCRAGEAIFCDQMTFVAGTGGAAAFQGGALNVASITPTSFNGAYYEVRGVDFSLVDEFDAGAAGRFTTRLLTTWMDQQTYQNCTYGAALGCNSYSILGQTGTGNNFLPDYTPDARWRGSLLVTWTQGPVSLTPSMNFVSHGVMDYLGITPSDPLYQQLLNGTAPQSAKVYGYHLMSRNYVPSYFLFNLNSTYSFREGAANGLQLFVQVNNIFNKQPPFTGGATAFGPSNANGGTNPIFFDTLGLAYRVGFRYNF